MTDYVALKGIMAPNTSVFGYQRGDRVHEDVVRNWDLKVDDDVAEGTELPVADDAAPVLERPGPEGTRSDWEKWAVHNGMSAEDAVVASQDDLEQAGPSEQEEQPVRPADSAKKADWQAYAKKLGADETWAYADTTTKSDLQAYEPPVGDTVAVAATEANQG